MIVIAPAFLVCSLFSSASCSLSFITRMTTCREPKVCLAGATCSRKENSVLVFCCKIRLVLGLIYSHFNARLIDFPCVFSCSSRVQTTLYCLLTLRRVQGISALPRLNNSFGGDFHYRLNPGNFVCNSHKGRSFPLMDGSTTA